ncbi:hypothetical protein [Streptomyces sp. NPDC057939]|uniref:hypothetical protein n=1 Tax=Streptomyces sp. NPDC057939 TaxID=3346284 RepID=UPI0036EC3D61
MEHPPQQPAWPPYAPPPAPSPSRAKIWAAGAAVVSAIAGVATAVAAFSNGSPPQPSAVPPPASSAVGDQPPQSPAVTAAPGTATGAGGAASVRWSGKVVLGLEGIDLSQVPPSKGSGFGIRPAAGRNGSSSMEVKGTVALWENPGDPTPQGCKDLLAAQSRNAVVVAEGDSVCLVDENSPIAALKVTATQYNEGSYGLIEGQLTTWNLRAAK